MNTGSPPIKVAGLGLSWDEKYALQYLSKLQEIGYSAKRIPVSDGKYLVGYSYRDFNMRELHMILNDLLNQPKI